MKDQLARVEAVFFGHVQGVGFRYTVRSLSADFPDISGYVKNMPDGSVLVIAEGIAGSIDRFIAGINDGMVRYIRDVKVTRPPYSGEFRNFDVRF
ncbi:MAG: acylphosphatase [Candidatus Omnitrophica bacterium]|nr:acylphosphatase [Candidatus Omnitrophota bacterium]